MVHQKDGQAHVPVTQALGPQDLHGHWGEGNESGACSPELFALGVHGGLIANL